MSDDEASSDRSSSVGRYLFGDTSVSSERSSHNQADAKLRSRSEDSSRLFHDSSGTTRIRNTEIERGVRIRNVISTQQNRRADEKQELHELNSRLDQLVDAVKQKKSQNDELQERISQFRNELLYSSGEGHRSRLDQDLQGAKVALNSVSEVNTMSKIRASRSMYELDRMREKYDEEVRWQSRDHDKIRLLESQRTESLHELNYLKENCESKKKSLLDDSDRNEKLREQLGNLANALDHEQESRIDLECQIQTLLEKKKFEQELHRVMRDELERLFANQPSNPMGFFTSELRDIKEKIREDFKKLNEFNSDSMRHEYELRYSKIVEEIEIKKKHAEEARLKAEMEEKTSFESLSAEIESNKEEVKNLKLQEFNLNKLLQELHDKFNELRSRHADTADQKQSEIDQLYEQINNLKADLSSMLSFSKSLDSEVAVYARLLNQRMNSFVTQTYTFENYENLVLKDEINESHRILEQNELKRKQQELEENNRRLKELEEQRRRQKELDELQRLKREREEEEKRRRQREKDEEERKKREYEELLKKQREEEEKRRIEHEEELRKKEEEERLRRQRDEEDRLRRQREEEEKRRKEYEEEMRKKAEEDRLRRQREEEERLRWQREEEEKRRKEYEEEMRKKAEEDRLRRQREEEERLRWQREEEERVWRQHDEEERLRREAEEKERQLWRQRQEEDKLRREYELEQERLRLLDEEKRRRDEQLRLQREYEERLRLQKIEEEEKRRREYEEQIRIHREYEEQVQHKKGEEERLREQMRVQREYEEQMRHKKGEEERLREQLRVQREYEEQVRKQRELEERRKQEEERLRIEQLRIQMDYEERIRRQREMEEERRRQRDKEIDDKLRRQLGEQKFQNYVVINTEFDQERTEREQRLKKEREEHEKYILEKLRQEQELIEAQKRQKYVSEQRIRSPRPINCVDNVHTYTKRIVEQNQQSRETFEEHKYRSDCNGGGNYEKQINIQLNPVPSQRSQSHTNLNNNTVHKNIVITNVNRSQSPPKNRLAINGSYSELNKAEATNKYAIKHKANRYVSGAIGILETALNGEYIILENLSSNKSVNLKGWYIHRFVPDQNINVTFKFANDTVLNAGEKLKVLSNRQRSSSMHDGLNRPPRPIKTIEKVITAYNIDNWGTYSKFSVTKLINQDGVDKAVLTQSLLKLPSSNNLSQMEEIPLPEGSELGRNFRTTTSKSTTNLNELAGNQMVRARSVSKPCCPETTTTTTTKTTTTSTTQQTTTTTTKNCCPDQLVTAKPPIVHVTRQF